MADQDRYANDYRDHDRDRLGQRDVYMDNRTGVGADRKGYRAEWGRGDGERQGNREQSYNQRRGENASFGESDYGQSDGGRTGYRSRDDDSRYGYYSGGSGRGSSETYGQGRYSQTGSRYAAGDQPPRDPSWMSYPARSNPDFYADESLSAGPGWAGEHSPRDSGRERYRGYGRDDNRGSDRYGMGYSGARAEAPDYRGREERSGRGFWDKAADRVASWFGGEDEGRESHRGKGPKGYRRSDERIREDVSDRLTDDHWLDASDIEVRVEGGDVTLSGAVKTRDDKRRAEQLAEQVSGVDNVQNTLRVQRSDEVRGDRTTGVPVSNTTANTTIPGASSNLGDLGTAKTNKPQ